MSSQGWRATRPTSRGERRCSLVLFVVCSWLPPVFRSSVLLTFATRDGQQTPPQTPMPTVETTTTTTVATTTTTSTGLPVLVAEPVMEFNELPCEFKVCPVAEPHHHPACRTREGVCVDSTCLALGAALPGCPTSECVNDGDSCFCECSCLDAAHVSTPCVDPNAPPTPQPTDPPTVPTVEPTPQPIQPTIAPSPQPTDVPTPATDCSSYRSDRRSDDSTGASYRLSYSSSNTPVTSTNRRPNASNRFSYSSSYVAYSCAYCSAVRTN